MADLKLKYGKSANIPATTENGSLLFTTDRKEIYLDQDAQRYLIKGPSNVQRTLQPNKSIDLTYENVQRINLEFDLTIEDPGENSLCLTITGISQGAGENGEDIENNYSIQFGEPVYTNRFIGEISIADRGLNNQLNVSYNINNSCIGQNKLNDVEMNYISSIQFYNQNGNPNFFGNIYMEEIYSI